MRLFGRGNEARAKKVGRAATSRFALFGVALVVLVPGCASGSRATSPLVQPVPLPTFHQNCSALTSTTVRTIPIDVVRRKPLGGLEPGALIVAAVCIHGQGPFDFLVDTGAAASAIDTQLARRLNLRTVVSNRPARSFGCLRQGSLAEIGDWSVGGLTLTPQSILVGTLHSPVTPMLAGLLGSDVLSSFGAVRIDYRSGILALGAGHQPTSDVPPGRSPAPLPSDLVAGTSHVVPMRVHVLSAPIPATTPPLRVTAVEPSVSLDVGSTPYTFAVDTGAGNTIVSPALAAEQRLTKLPQSHQTYAGLACRVTVHVFHMSSWRLAGQALAPQTVGSNVVPASLDGLLGSGTLQSYSPIVVDYDDGELLISNYGNAP